MTLGQLLLSSYTDAFTANTVDFSVDDSGPTLLGLEAVYGTGVDGLRPFNAGHNGVEWDASALRYTDGCYQQIHLRANSWNTLGISR